MTDETYSVSLASQVKKDLVRDWLQLLIYFCDY